MTKLILLNDAERRGPGQPGRPGLDVWKVLTVCTGPCRALRARVTLGPMDEMLKRAQADFRRAAVLPYPAGLTVSARWTGRQAEHFKEISEYASAADAVRRAQGPLSGYDHREFKAKQITQVINFKLAELSLLFPGFDLKAHAALTESALSVTETLLDIGDGRTLSSIFLTHLYFYLRTTSFVKPKRVLELGTGYGGLARIFKLMKPDTTYVLVDLPESLFYAQVFLQANFPEARTCYAHDTLPADLDSYDFVFVPAQNCTSLQGHAFDLTINTGSLQEMPGPTVFYWMHFIEQVIRTRNFYSWNYFLNDKTKFGETGADCSLLCPVLDPFWIPRYFRINESVITVDASARNWLEVFLERIPPAQQAGLDRLGYANRLIEAANVHRAFTNHWFKNTWMAIWVNPEPHIIDAMIDGIRAFERGEAFGIRNHLTGSVEFGELKFYQRMKESVFPI